MSDLIEPIRSEGARNSGSQTVRAEMGFHFDERTVLAGPSVRGR
jgi:hypothetical protein